MQSLHANNSNLESSGDVTSWVEFLKLFMGTFVIWCWEGSEPFCLQPCRKTRFMWVCDGKPKEYTKRLTLKLCGAAKGAQFSILSGSVTLQHLCLNSEAASKTIYIYISTGTTDCPFLKTPSKVVESLRSNTAFYPLQGARGFNWVLISSHRLTWT